MNAAARTIDSQLILSSATIVNDLYLNYINPGAGEKGSETSRIHWLSFWTTAIVGTIVFAASFNPPDLIVWINLFAFGGLQAAFLWPLVLGLYWKRANAAGAFASMTGGVASYFYLVIYVKRLWGMHVIVPTLLIALVLFIVFSIATDKPEDDIIRIFWGE